MEIENAQFYTPAAFAAFKFAVRWHDWHILARSVDPLQYQNFTSVYLIIKTGVNRRR